MRSRPIHAPFWVQIHYVLRAVITDLIKKPLGTLLTLLAISLSLTLPLMSYVLWKNVYHATTVFSLDAELTVYLHKNLTEEDANLVVEKIRDQAGIESLNYISRQESLKEFRAWSGLGDALDILEDNPLPAVVMITPSQRDQQTQQQLRENLANIKGVQEVRFDNDWLEKLTALSWLSTRIAIFSTLLMLLVVILVIGNSIRADVYHSQADIEVMKLLGATQQFVLRPFLYTGIIYALLGGLLAYLCSLSAIAYFTQAVNTISPLFNAAFILKGINLSEMLFLIILCILMGYSTAWLAATRHIRLLDKKE